jgi:integrase
MTRKRRGRNEGSIFERADGLWVATLSLGADGNGKRKRKTIYGASKKEVQDKLATLHQRALQGELANEERTTVGQWLDAWLKLHERAVGTTTYDMYEQHVRLHLKPHLGGVRLRDLKPLHGEVLLAALVEAGASVAMQAKVIGTLRTALRAAAEGGVIRAVPAIKKPKGSSSRRPDEIEVWSQADVRAFLEAVKGNRMEVMYTLALDSGMRQGELFGLPWDAIDWEAGAVSIRQALLERKGRLQLKEPKTKESRRRIRLTQETLAALNRHRQRMIKDGLYNKDGLVFVDVQGGPLRKSNVHRRSFVPALKRANVKAIRFHDLRHTAATTWLANGINIKAVSSLGHARIQITLDTYSHFLPQMDEEVVSVNQRVLFG